ncbi:MAG: ABC transporter ATP-binding protein [Gammaproteobacteria bacterium]|nr:MAG: ABC transporter ATP-binding protein [Gammaproteobacteria bacterium]
MSRGGHFHVAGLRKRFGRRLLLDDVELHLHETSCTLLTGENGAGKSTLLRILAGLEKPDGGSFRLGRRLYPSWRKARRSLQKAVMYLHQQPYLFDGSVEYNLRLALGGQREGQEALIRTALQWIDMESFRETPARTLSGGERQRLALARAWLASPEIMLLDEPTANLDTESRGRTLELLRGLRNQGIVLVIASHDPHHFEELAECRIDLHNGRLTHLAPRGAGTVQSAKVIPIRQGYA